MSSKKLDQHINMDHLHKIKNNCRKATQLIEKRQLGKLSLWERVTLKIHLKGCSICRLFETQSIAINKKIKQLVNPDQHPAQLDDAYKTALQDKIDERLDQL